MSSSGRYLIIVPAAGVALGLGYVGYRSIPHGGYSPTDAIYWSLDLFYGREGSTPGGTPWTLDVGRFLALAVVAYAALLTVVLLLRDRGEAWWVRRFARNHALVVGSSQTAVVVVEGLTAAGETVVVTDVVSRSREVVGMRAARARAVTGDATQASIMSAARVSDAKLVVVATGDDERNLSVLNAAMAVGKPGAGRKPIFHVALDDVDAWRELSHIRLAAQGEVTVEFFNAADRAALVLVGAASDFSVPGKPHRALIDGSGPVAIRTVVHIVRRSLLMGGRAEIELSSEGGHRLELELRQHEPWSLDAADIRFDGVSAPTLAIVVGGGTDAATLARGALLVRRGACENVVVGVERATWADGLRRPGLTPASLHVVPIGAESQARQLIEASGIEILARARHDDYVRNALERGESPGANPTLMTWDQLPDSLKESNRRFAETVATHIGALGAGLRPLAHTPVAALTINDAVLDELARDEHERWVASLEADGWRHTSGPKDPHAKLHPLLVPWEELSETDQQKDRDVFRGLPRMLAYVGYELELPDDESLVSR